ncbi:hypothetical protein FQA47_020368 [Oryzias melastigma]|uniref:Uncharacterized protein n=1 Tax=Oryzias melastigma TaxID=30732 RepID=A0A834C3X3_ORYME|nr:hypothetical protein FQA47_020368 [Oryzias melastigma]
MEFSKLQAELCSLMCETLQRGRKKFCFVAWKLESQLFLSKSRRGGRASTHHQEQQVACFVLVLHAHINLCWLGFDSLASHLDPVCQVQQRMRELSLFLLKKSSHCTARKFNQFNWQLQS